MLEFPCPKPADRLSEWIVDREAAELSAMLKILAQQYAASSIDCRRDDQCIVESHRMVARQRNSSRVNRHRQRQGRPEEVFYDAQSCLSLRPFPGQFAACHVCEFIQNLHPDHAPVCQQRLGLRAARVVGRKSVNQDVGIEELVTGHLPHPDRSGILSAGPFSARVVARVPAPECDHA